MKFRFLVYAQRSAEGPELLAGFSYAEDAAILVGVLGKGTQIRSGDTRRTLWHEGFEETSASESFDTVAEVVEEREQSGLYVVADNSTRRDS